MGKTSLASRFVTDSFSDRYRTTVGVNIDHRDVALPSGVVRMLVWDLHGEDEYQHVRPAYLRGSSGCLVVVDGTRPATLDAAVRLAAWARQLTGPIPYGLVLNKTDLEAEWEVDEAQVKATVGHDMPIFHTSARCGSGVHEVFFDLAARMRAPRA